MDIEQALCVEARGTILEPGTVDHRQVDLAAMCVPRQNQVKVMIAKAVDDVRGVSHQDSRRARRNILERTVDVLVIGRGVVNAHDPEPGVQLGGLVDQEMGPSRGHGLLQRVHRVGGVVPVAGYTPDPPRRLQIAEQVNYVTDARLHVHEVACDQDQVGVEPWISSTIFTCTEVL